MRTRDSLRITAAIMTLVTLISCSKDNKQSLEAGAAYPVTIAIMPVPGTFYVSSGGMEYFTPYYTDSYRLLRDTVWESFVANTGDDINYGYVGQIADVWGSDNMDGDQWSWAIEYQGYTCEYKYTLSSKSAYKRASLFLYLARGDYYTPEEKREFVPCYLTITTYNHSPFFELHLDEDFDFWEAGETPAFKEYELSQWQFNALQAGTDVPLYVDISTFKEINPLPEVPPAWPEGANFTRCSMCAISFYITLYP